MSRVNIQLRSTILFLLLLGAVIASLPARAYDDKPHWILVNSSHYSLLTDATEKKANQTILRMEEIRIVFGQLLHRSKLNMSEPLEMIGFANSLEYSRVMPLGRTSAASGFFIPGADRNYIVLDMSDDQSWRTVAHRVARVYLNYNYPPTQPWFDEGFIEYFSSLGLNEQEGTLGADPADFISTLSAETWLPITKLFTTELEDRQGDSSSIFRAQAWIVMHYLLAQEKLPETGTYLGLVKIKKLPIEEAIHQAYGMSAAQLDQAVKTYFQAITAAGAENSKPATTPGTPGTPAAPALVHHFAPPLAPLDVGTSVKRLEEYEAKALVQEMALRLPDYRAQAVQELQTSNGDPKEDTSIAHRGLAWVHIQDRDFGSASEELQTAAGLDPKDPWPRYYLSLAKYEEAALNKGALQGLPNMLQDLHAVLDWKPDFAEAYNMLAMAQLRGGGTHAAETTMQSALQLDPRSDLYRLNMARIYLAGKKWDDATALLNPLKESRITEIADAAGQNLRDIPSLKKYGIPPQMQGVDTQPETIILSNNTDDHDDAPDTPSTAKSHELEIDQRKIDFVKGKLLAVDCSRAPAAVLKISTGGKTMNLRTEDSKSLLVIGATTFSCGWRNLLLGVNYKAGGKADGDLVSVEVQ